MTTNTATQATAAAHLARTLAERSRHLPRVAQHAQVAVLWAAIAHQRAERARTDPTTLWEVSEAQDTLQAALVRALAEVMTDALGGRLVERRGRATPPPLVWLLERFPEEVVAAVPPEVWRAAWGMVRSAVS